MIRPHPPNNHAYLIHTLLYANHHSTPKYFTILAQRLHGDSEHQHNDTEYAQNKATVHLQLSKPLWFGLEVVSRCLDKE